MSVNIDWVFGSAVKIAGDVNTKVPDNASLDDLFCKIQDELRKLGPLIDLEAIREPQQSRTQGGFVEVHVTRASGVAAPGWNWSKVTPKQTLVLSRNIRFNLNRDIERMRRAAP